MRPHWIPTASMTMTSRFMIPNVTMDMAHSSEKTSSGSYVPRLGFPKKGTLTHFKTWSASQFPMFYTVPHQGGLMGRTPPESQLGMSRKIQVAHFWWKKSRAKKDSTWKLKLLMIRFLHRSSWQWCLASSRVPLKRCLPLPQLTPVGHGFFSLDGIQISVVWQVLNGMKNRKFPPFLIRMTEKMAQICTNHHTAFIFWYFFIFIALGNMKTHHACSRHPPEKCHCHRKAVIIFEDLRPLLRAMSPSIPSQKLSWKHLRI